jgi:hypothetical protein
VQACDVPNSQPPLNQIISDVGENSSVSQLTIAYSHATFWNPLLCMQATNTTMTKSFIIPWLDTKVYLFFHGITMPMAMCVATSKYF